MGIKFIDDELVIGGGDWELAPFKFSKILKIGGGGSPTPSWVDIVVSGTGSVTLANAKADGLNYVKLFGKAMQPQPDKPNLLIDLHKYSQYGVSVTIGDDNSIILNGKANSTSTITIKYSLTTRKLPAGTYTLAVYDKPAGDWTGTRICVPTSAKYVDFGSSSDTSITFTYTSDQSFLCYVRVVNGTVYDNFTIKAMLVEGSTAPLTYTPALPCMANPVAITCNNGDIKYGATNKNLLDMTDSNIVIGYYINNNGVETSAVANFYNKKFIPVSASTTYTWSTSTSINYINFMEYDATKTFIKRTLIGSTGEVAGTSGQFTTGKDTAYLLIGSNPFGGTLTLEQVKTVNWQFELGSTATAYVPYQAGIYTDGTVETVEVTGKNLNGGGALDNKGYTSTGGTSSSTTFCGTLWKIKVKEGEKYTVSYGNFPDGISGVFVNTWKTDGTWNLRQAISISASYTYIIPAGIGEVNFTLYKTGGITLASNSWMQVEKGDTATAYEPYYNGGSATAENLLGLDTVKDVQNITTGDITRNIGVYVFDGTETYLYSPSYGGAVVVKDFINTYGVNTNKLPMCNYFLGEDQGNSTSAQNGKSSCFWIPSYNYIGFLTDFNSSTAKTEFAQWVKGLYDAGTPLMVAYAKTTATTESATPQALTTKSGNNIIEITQASINNLPLEVSYKGIQEQQGE